MTGIIQDLDDRVEEAIEEKNWKEGILCRDLRDWLMFGRQVADTDYETNTQTS